MGIFCQKIIKIATRLSKIIKIVSPQTPVSAFMMQRRQLSPDGSKALPSFKIQVARPSFAACSDD